MSRLTRDGTAEPVSRDQILRHERGQGNIHFPCSADHEQDWQPYPVDPYSCYTAHLQSQITKSSHETFILTPIYEILGLRTGQTPTYPHNQFQRLMRNHKPLNIHFFKRSSGSISTLPFREKKKKKKKEINI